MKLPSRDGEEPGTSRDQDVNHSIALAAAFFDHSCNACEAANAAMPTAAFPKRFATMASGSIPSAGGDELQMTLS